MLTNLEKVKACNEMFGYVPEGYKKLNFPLKKAMMATEEQMNISYDTAITSYWLGPLNPQVCTSVPCAKMDTCPQKGNNPMYVDNDKHIESSKINYLSARAANVQYGKEQGMRKTFGLVDDYAPETAAELVKRIQDGKFLLKDDSKDKTCYDPTRFIKWRDPAVKEDQAGYKAAVDALGKVYQDTKDTIAIGTPAEGLAAVKALDAWTPTVGTA